MTWQTPRELPDLRRVGIIALDTETRDAGLQTNRGSSWPWGDGYVCGISLARREGGENRAIYIPMRHPNSVNFDTAQVYRWLKDHIAAGVCFVTMNGLYDWGWLRTDGGVLMPPANQLEEVGALAAMVDENQLKYSLDAICQRHGLPGKDTALLEEACKAAGFKIGKDSPSQSYIWRLPADVVGPYAEIDAIRTLEVFEILKKIVESEGTRDAYRLEVDLLPMVHEMRRRGIRIDQDAAEQAYDLLIGKRDAALTEISDQHGAAVSMAEIQGRKWLEKTFDGYGISYPRTAKGNPSFSTKKSGWMVSHEHWLPRQVAAARKYNHAGETFIRKHILSHIVNGRVHGEIRPHLSEEGGTISFRFSYASPPLQQMPKRDEEIGPLIRSAFLPEEGEFWAETDASQQEFRGWVHYGVQHGLPSAQEAAKAYHADPKTDYHELVGKITELGRDTAKTANFAKGYGSGAATFAKTIGKSHAEAAAIMAQYDAKLPFVTKLFHIEQEKAARTGITRLYDGALRHWNLYAPPWRDHEACSLEEARRRVTDPKHTWYGQYLGRAGTRKAFNALVQGLGARHTKLWMRLCFREGIIPLLQMHDALECSVTSREQGEMIARLGEEAVTLNVPMKVDLKFGKTWGTALHSWEELTGESAPAQPVSRPSPKPAPVTPLKPAIIVPPPIISIPLPPPAITPAKSAIFSLLMPGAPTEKKKKQPLPPTPPLDDMEIDLADLIDQPVPRNRKICCPFHNERTPSMHIYPDHYYCFGCGAYGDRADWLMQVEGLSYDEALDVLENWDGSLVPRIPTSNDKDEIEERRVRALQLWEAAKPIASTLASRYLAETRGIDLNALPPSIEEALRFHPHCPFGPGVTHPCLLALMRDAVGNAPTGIQRIALSADARKIDRMMYGPAGVVKLWTAGGERLVIGEGLETTLAAATRLPYRGAPLQPAWAMLSSGRLAEFPVIAGVERLIVLADHDPNGAGQAAADACIQRWAQAGRAGVRLLPERPGTDFNDVVMELLERAP